MRIPRKTFCAKIKRTEFVCCILLKCPSSNNRVLHSQKQSRCAGHAKMTRKDHYLLANVKPQPRSRSAVSAARFRDCVISVRAIIRGPAGGGVAPCVHIHVPMPLGVTVRARDVVLSFLCKRKHDHRARVAQVQEDASSYRHFVVAPSLLNVRRSPCLFFGLQ